MTLDDLIYKPGLLAGQRVLVTGGGTGLGRVMSEALLLLGAEIHICGRRGAVVEQTASELMAQHGGRVVPWVCDIRSDEAIQAMHHHGVRRALVQAHEAPDVPHQQPRVQLVIAQAAADPARAPVAQRHDDGTQLFARVGQGVFPDLAHRAAPHKTDLLQVPQALRQQAGGHARDAAVQVVEAPAATQKFAHDQRCPALTQRFGAPRHGAELAVAVRHRVPLGSGC